MECPLCHVEYEEILVIADANHRTVSGCYVCLKERKLLEPAVSAAA